MIKKTGLLTLYLLAFFVVLSFIHFPFLPGNLRHTNQKNRNENHAPLVKIISPKNNTAYRWNTLVPYEISVSDQEDGESKYQEINPKEVFLEIRYVKDSAEALAEIKKDSSEDPPELSTIKISNCMNCHAFKTKLIGPSFYEIERQYHKMTDIKDNLANHILNGSKGRWGEVQMPANNKLNESEAKEVIQWIFKNAGDSTVDYLAGIEGSFRLNSPDASLKNIILVASYTDHGSKDEPSKSLKGKDIVVIQGK